MPALQTANAFGPRLIVPQGDEWVDAHRATKAMPPLHVRVMQRGHARAMA